jgi:hypothetical protein
LNSVRISFDLLADTLATFLLTLDRLAGILLRVLLDV